jgi:hypothetical protein
LTIFEQASRVKLRFASPVNDLTTEQLWDLPLMNKSGRPSLDGIARAVHLELKGLEEVSFVDCKPDPRKVELELQLDILKRVIAVKLAERDAAQLAVQNAERKKKLMAVLAAKEDDQLAGMSKEEIEAEIARLGQ